MAKPIMVQGTTSNAGKSLVSAGLCRIFREDGYRVSPFKSQNMALNSFITKEGLEMGRAQVMQAEAAKIEPSVLMNPILLKPTSDVGSQVIVKGKVVGTMSAAEYFSYKSGLREVIMKAYGMLASQSDVMVIEGAGSPAEINLKDDDIVNMGMAEMADAPVLLVGDIDRGGVFASLYGTIALLEENERARIKGVIVNKFRGDKEILRPGLDMLEKLVHVPVAGVIPYMHLDLDDEDSLSERLTDMAPGGLLDIAVIRLPRISNFTDFNVFPRMDGVGLRYVGAPGMLGEPDLIILPGTKNTMGDLLWMRESGLEAAVRELAARGTPVIGVCGGYQMLGYTLDDPEGIEEGGSMRGMELLPVSTVFEKKKVRTRVTGTVCQLNETYASLSGSGLTGYEIHMGRTMLMPEAAPFSTLADGAPDGAVYKNVFGSYIHGLFDCGLGSAVVRMLMESKGVDYVPEISTDTEAYKEQQYDALAKTLRENLDMDLIYGILNSDR